MLSTGLRERNDLDSTADSLEQSGNDLDHMIQVFSKAQNNDVASYQCAKGVRRTELALATIFLQLRMARETRRDVYEYSMRLADKGGDPFQSRH